MSFYLWAMRGASAILFVIALLQLVVGTGFQLWNYLRMSGGIEVYAPGAMGGSPLVTALGALVSGLATAMWPLFGAALLWRIDRWIRPQAKGTAE
jgi:hypothetical protein